VLNNVKYVFIYENESLNIFKEVDSQIVNLNSEEEEDIKKILDSKRNYIYNTDLLVELINKNDQIENKQYIYNFLSWLENVIPLDYRNNFYNNIKTLKTDLKLDYEFSSNNILEHNKYGSTASYNVKENTLIMDANSLLQAGDSTAQADTIKDVNIISITGYPQDAAINAVGLDDEMFEEIVEQESQEEGTITITLEVPENLFELFEVWIRQFAETYGWELEF